MKQMCWASGLGSDRPSLYLNDGSGWKNWQRSPYATALKLRPLDGQHSDGWHIYSALFKQGWQVVPKPAYMPSVDPLIIKTNFLPQLREQLVNEGYSSGQRVEE